eukprot:412478-Rhodomonas_salina.2
MAVPEDTEGGLDIRAVETLVACQVPAYAIPATCLPQGRIVLRAYYAIPGTTNAQLRIRRRRAAYGSQRREEAQGYTAGLRARYAMPGTDIAYGPRQTHRGRQYARVRTPYLPTRLLCHVRY